MSGLCNFLINGHIAPLGDSSLELKNLRAFIAVAERESFVRAATHLYLSQPAITAQIKSLEQELGVLLFDRSRRTVRTTAAGEAFLSGARDTLATAEEAARAAQRAAQEQTQRLRFSFPPSATREIVPSILDEFQRLHPHVKLDLFSFHTSITVTELQKKTIDLGFVRLPLEAKGLNVIPAHHEPMVLCLPADHPLCSVPDIDISDLRTERFIMYHRKWAPGFHDRLIECCQTWGFSPIVSNEIDEMYLAPVLVGAGEGIAILPRMAILSPAHNVVTRELHTPGLYSELGIATRAIGQSPMVEAAILISQMVCRRYSIH